MTPTVRIVKMSGAGNDFVVLGGPEAAALGDGLQDWTRAVCRRGLSVGADGVLVVEPLGNDRVRLRFVNPDGSWAFCGNGTRCAARFAHREGYCSARHVVETCAGDVPAEVDGQNVRLTLPMPENRGALTLEADGAQVQGSFVIAGSPHFVIPVTEPDDWPLESRGPWIRRHPAFGDAGVNVDLVTHSRDGALRIRTWERGVEAETLSCGSGALAAARVAFDAGRRGRLRILPRGGIPLFVELPTAAGAEAKLTLEGDARWIFSAVLGEESLTKMDGS